MAKKETTSGGPIVHSPFVDKVAPPLKKGK